MMALYLQKLITEPFCWIITIGNPVRGDDGAGPFVAGRLQTELGHITGVKVRNLHQLDISLLDDVKNAKALIFVDACKAPLDKGLQWSKVIPEGKNAYFSPHHLTPEVFTVFLERLYHRRPLAWQLSIRGYDFSFSEILTFETRRNAEKAVDQILLRVSFLRHELPPSIF